MPRRSLLARALPGSSAVPVTALVVALLFAVAVPMMNAVVPLGSPLHLPDYVIPLIGKYLCFAILALALDLVWGYCGVLSLGHGAFFALGGYAMGMYLMRQIGTRGVYRNPILPDFMVFLNWKELPWYWFGFNHFWFAAVMVMLVPGLLATVFGFLAFRSRITGVYLSIITQAMTYALLLAFFRNDMGFGGNNGLTDFKELLGFDLQARGTKLALYFASLAAVVLALLICRMVVATKLGRVMMAVRDAEARVRFLGYSVTSVKLFAFVLSRCSRGSRGRSTCRRSASSIPANSLPATRSRWRSGSPSVGAARWSARSWARWWSTRPRPICPRPFPRHGSTASAALFILVTLAAAARRHGPGRANEAAPPERGPPRGGETCLTRQRRAAEAGPVATGSILYLDGVTVSFDGFKALNSLSLVIAPGELRTVIGPNGAGKTTMMDVITGKTRPDTGDVLFDGSIDLTRLDEAAIANLGIGRKFQKPTVFEHLTVFENLELALKTARGTMATLFFRLAPAQRDESPRLIGTVGLSDRASVLAGALSHGQKQWLEIGMLLMQDQRCCCSTSRSPAFRTPRPRRLPS